MGRRLLARPARRLRRPGRAPHGFGCGTGSSVPHLLEISDASAGKGAALRRLAQHLDIPREQIAAFGNEENDLDMIAFAGVGVAVANSPAHVRDCANFVTGSNDEDGVADFLERYLIQQ